MLLLVREVSRLCVVRAHFGMPADLRLDSNVFAGERADGMHTRTQRTDGAFNWNTGSLHRAMVVACWNRSEPADRAYGCTTAEHREGRGTYSC